jgi:hypothetical protein
VRIGEFEIVVEVVRRRRVSRVVFRALEKSELAPSQPPSEPS